MNQQFAPPIYCQRCGKAIEEVGVRVRYCSLCIKLARQNGQRKTTIKIILNLDKWRVEHE